MAAGNLPRELVVLRHGKSSWDSSAPTDFERPLGKRGRKDAPRMGLWMVEDGCIPDAVISSPATRAKETAESAIQAAGGDPEGITYDRRLYGATLRDLLEVLRGAPSDAERLLLVGHNPGLETLVSWLPGNRPASPPDGKLMPTCALARIALPADWTALEAGCGFLLQVLRPRTLLY